LEFEVMKLVLLRESYLKKLARVLKEQKGEINLNVIGVIDTIRDCSVETIEVIQEWERTQFTYPLTKPFSWNGQNYVEKMCEDYQFLSEYPSVSNWLGFSPESNPFFVPPECLANDLEMVPNSFIVFGVRPPEPPKPPRAKAIMPKFVKSPYLTPIVNDLDAFPQNSQLAKSKKKEKIRAIAQTAADNEQKLSLDRALDAPTDPYQTFIGHDIIKRAMKCRKYVRERLPDHDMFGSSILSNAHYSPSSSFVTATSMPPGHQGQGGSPGREKTAEGVSAPLPPAPSAAVAGLGSSLEEGSLDHGAAAGGVATGDDKAGSGDGEQRQQSQSRGMSSQRSPLRAGADVASQSAAGHAASTSLFSNSQTAFDETQEPFRASLLSTAQREALENPSMRLQTVADMGLAEGSLQSDVRTDGYQSFLLSQSVSQGPQSMTGSATSNTSQYWTPHEIKLQKAVNRRGGELFVLTAAGTKGRIKAPWRRTRFQRLTEDLRVIEQQSVEVKTTLQERWATLQQLRKQAEEEEVEEDGAPASKKQRHASANKKEVAAVQREIADLEDSSKGIDNWANTLRLQHDSLKMVLNVDDVGDLHKQREMHAKLGDGQALEEDELTAQNLEDRMASIIQRNMKKSLGRSIRKAIIARRNKAAQVLQNLVRKKANEGLAYERGIRLTLAMKVQKLWRGRGGKEAARRMAKEQQQRAALFLLNRVARGYLARLGTRRKRTFIKAVMAAKHEVSLDCLNPDDLEKLADTIEAFLKNFTLTLPMEVITILRGLLYMFIGDEEDFVTIDNSGYVEPVSIFASTAGWDTHRLLLRRKGKFLRRMRSIINYLSPPGPRRLVFTKSCLKHMSAVCKIRVQALDVLSPKDKQTMLHFHSYIVNIKTAYDMQEEFPTYFIPVQPQWYKNLIAAERLHQDALNEKRVQKYIGIAIDEIRKRFVAEGKAWRFVRVAGDWNTRDSAIADALVEKAINEYNRLLYFFEKDEQLNMQLREGFLKSNEFGVIVADRDFKAFMDKEGDYAPEWKIAEMRLTCDKAHLKLLEAQNALYFARKYKERDLEARDWKKHINLRYVHEICRDEGAVIGKLYIIKQQWEKFVRELGGVQYVFDLRGAKKKYYMDTRSSVLKLVQRRRELHKRLEVEMTRQFKVAADAAHEARVGMKASIWDDPTDMERKSEAAEDIECRQRDADIEAKEVRAAKRLRIPSAPFKPMMLLVDTRVPKSVANVLRSKLERLHFKEVTGRVDDPALTLTVQSYMDNHLNVFMFVDRGTNVTARSFFLGFFRSLLYSLIPTPRVVALDAFLDLRFENWFTDSAADFHQLYKYNKNSSTTAALALGRLRRTAMMFRQFLLMESAQEERDAGCFEIMPEWLRPIFRNDLDDFVAEIEDGEMDARIAGDDANTMFTMRTGMEHAGMILSATIALLLDWWAAPVLEWKSEQVLKGCSIFLDKVKDAPALVDTLWLERFPPTTVKQRMRIQRAMDMAPVWREIEKCNFYEQPARYLLARWALETMQLVEILVVQGGGVDETFEKSNKVAYARNLDWLNDVSRHPDTVAEQLVGELLEASMEDALVYEDEEADVVEYVKREELEDVQAQYFTATETKKRVRVYHSHTRAFVSVSVGGHDGRNPIWHYFDTLEMVDFVSMLQPNNTEMYDGTVTNYDVGEGGKDKWWEVISQWARLERTATSHNLILLRNRTLILTKLGTISGHLCRFEIFEERFGELLVLVHGLGCNTGTVYVRANRHFLAELGHVADPTIEKQSIELKEALPISYIVTDRLQVRPTASQLHWLQNGELEPKTLWNKPLEVSCRLRGGPGRLVGRRLFQYQGVRLCVTIYEVTNASDIQQLRLVIYEQEHSQSLEIRLSDLEKVMLFNDLSPIIEQVCGRLRTVYCKPRADGRGVILFRQDYRPKQYPEYIVDGEEEWDILDDIQLQEARAHAGSDSLGGDEDSLGSIEKLSTLPSAGSSVLPASLMPSSLLEVDVGNESDDDTKLSRGTFKEAEPWRWGFYFYRGIANELMGNLDVSINLNLAREGFEFIVLDNRSLYELYKFVSYEEILPYFFGVSKIDFYKNLQAMDETVVLEVAEELYQMLEITEGLDSDGVGVLRMQISSPGEKEPLVLAYLREHELTAMDMSRRSMKKSKVSQITEGRLHVLGARNLSTVSGIAARNPIAITKWNMRECDRTMPVRNTVSPDWNDMPAEIKSTKDKLFRECFLEVEVWDWNFQKARTDDFLGCVRIGGDTLIDLFDRGAKKKIVTLPLKPSPRFTDSENQHVQGELLLFGVKGEAMDKISEKDIPQSYRIDDAAQQKELAKLERAANGEEEPTGMFGGWGKSKKETATPTKEEMATTEGGGLVGVPENEPLTPGTPAAAGGTSMPVTRKYTPATPMDKRQTELSMQTEAALSPAARKHSIHILNLTGDFQSRQVVGLSDQRVRFSIRHKLKQTAQSPQLASRGGRMGNSRAHSSAAADTIGPDANDVSNNSSSAGMNMGMGIGGTGTPLVGGRRSRAQSGLHGVLEEGDESNMMVINNNSGSSQAGTRPGSGLLEGSQLSGPTLEDFDWPGEERKGGNSQRGGRAPRSIDIDDGYANDDEATLPTYAPSIAATDDTYSIVGFERFSAPRKRLRVELLQLEGLPLATQHIMVVVKFNGYVAGRSPVAATVSSVTVDPKSGELLVSSEAEAGLLKSKKRAQVMIGKAHTIEDEAVKRRLREETKEAEREARRKARANTKEAKAAAEEEANRRAAEEDSLAGDETVGDNGTADGSASKASASKASGGLDDASFMSEDRLEQEEEVLYNSSGRIPDRVRRADRGGLVLFPAIAPIYMTVPPAHELGSCSVEFEVWDMASSVLLGTADVRGSRLTALVDGGSSALPGLDGEWLAVTDPFTGHTASFRNTCGSMVDLRIMSRADDPEVAAAREYLYYELALFSVMGVPRSLVVPPEADEENGVAEKPKSSTTHDDRPASAESGEGDAYAQDDIASVDSAVEEHKERVREASGLFIRVMLNGVNCGESALLSVDDSDGGDGWSWDREVLFKLKVPLSQDLGSCDLRLEAISRVGSGEMPSPEQVAAEVARAVESGVPGATASAQYGSPGLHFHDTLISVCSISGSTLMKLLRAGKKGDHEEEEELVDDEESLEVDETGVVDMQALMNKQVWEPQEYKGGLTHRYRLDPAGSGQDKEELDDGNEVKAKEDEDTPPSSANVNAGAGTARAANPNLPTMTIEIAGLPTTAEALLVEEDEMARSITTREESMASRNDGERVKTPHTPNPALTPTHLRDLGVGEATLTGIMSPPGSAHTVVAGWSSRPGTGPLGLGREVSTPGQIVHPHYVVQRQTSDDGSYSDGAAPGENDGAVQGRNKHQTAILPGQNNRQTRADQAKEAAIKAARKVDGGGGQRLLLNSATQLLRDKLGGGEGGEDEQVRVLRQNCMAEVQDLPQRKLTLVLRAIEITGKKPFGMGGAGGMFSSAPTKQAAAAANNESVALVTSASRMSRGLAVLARYVDCAKAVHDGMSKREAEEAERTAAAAAEKKRLEIEAVRSGAGRRNKKQKAAAGAGDEDNALDEAVTGEQKASTDGTETPPVAPLAEISGMRRTSTFGHHTAGQRNAALAGRKRLYSILHSVAMEIELPATPSPKRSRLEGAGVDGKAGAGASSSGPVVSLGELDGMYRGVNGDGDDASLGFDERVAFDPLVFREVQVFFNGRFVHEVTVPVRYTESLTAFTQMLVAAANAGAADDDTATLASGSTSPSKSPSRAGGAGVDMAGVSLNGRRGSVADENPFEEKVSLFVPRGQLLEGCRLELVVWHLDKHAKKQEVMGLRLFEGEDLVKLFQAEEAKPAAVAAKPSTAPTPGGKRDGPGQGLEQHSSLTAQSSATVTFAPTESIATTEGGGGATKKQEPFVADGAAGRAALAEEVNVVDMDSPRARLHRAKNAFLYDMEAPPGSNDNNADGIALASERLELVGAGEAAFGELPSGTDLGVQAHRGPRRKVEVRLLGLHGLLEGMEVAPGVPQMQGSTMGNDTEMGTALGGNRVGQELSASLLPENSLLSDNSSPALNSPSVDSEDDTASPPAGFMARGMMRGYSSRSMLTRGASRGVSSRNLAGLGNAEVDEQAEAERRRVEEEEKKKREMQRRRAAEDAAEAAREYLYVSVRWNGQEVRASQPRPMGDSVLWGEQEEDDDAARRQHLQKKKVTGEALQRMSPQGLPLPPQVDAVGASVFTMYVPRGHRLRGCYLELVVWSLKSDTALGSVLLHGEDLVGFLEGFGSVQDDDDLYDEYDPDDAAGGTTHRQFPLQPCTSVPRDRQAQEVRGRIVVRARVASEGDHVRGGTPGTANPTGSAPRDLLRRRPWTTTNPYGDQQNRQFKTQVRLRKHTHFVPMFKIRSKLRRGRTGWRHFYSVAEGQRVEALEKSRLHEASRVKALSALERSHYDRIIAEKAHDAEEASVEASVASRKRAEAHREWLKLHVVEQRTGANLPVKMLIATDQHHLSLSAVKYQKASKEQEEDCRVCWRGRAMPKHFKGGLTKTAKETMMKSRASRLIRTGGVDDLKITADVHFLKDTDQAQKVENEALPIVVKEIVSSGPGMCTRVYRMSIETNAGQAIGSTDLSSDMDVVHAVGEEGAGVFGDRGREAWNMKAIFEHIVKERAVIDFMPENKKAQDKAKKQEADSIAKLSSASGKKDTDYKKSSKGAKGENIQQDRRGAVSSSGKKGGGHEVISVTRDDFITPPTRFKAIYGMYVVYLSVVLPLFLLSIFIAT
jgi:hypothetical protein